MVPEPELAVELSKRLGYHKHWRSVRQLCDSPYVHGADIDVRAIYKRQLAIDCPKVPTHYSTGFLDIEASVCGGEEINLITYVDTDSRTVCTAALQSFMADHTVDKIRAIFDTKLKELRGKLNAKARSLLDAKPYVFKFRVFEDERDLIRSIFSAIHKFKPDFVGIWNEHYDIPKILSRMEYFNMDPCEVMCHPDVPKELRYVKYKYSEKKTDHITDKWPWLEVSGYTQFLDSMCLYSRLRIVKGREVSYALKYIATKILGAGKLDFGEADHYVMQTEHFDQYCVYNAVDAMLLDLMEGTHNDISQLTALIGSALLKDFNHQTTMILYFFYDYCRSHKLVPGSTGSSSMRQKGDEKIVNIGGNVLSPLLVKDAGVPILEGSDIETKLQLFVLDSDAASMYPSILMAFNIAKETKTDTIISIEDMPKNAVEDFFENVTDPTGNAMYLGSRFFNLPSCTDIVKLWDTTGGIAPDTTVYEGTITELAPNEVFVFGSNTEGRHGKGAALKAKEKFGAKYGVASGPTGHCYAIVTKDLSKPDGAPSVSRDHIVNQIRDLYAYAHKHPNIRFLVAYTAVGKNLNNYTPAAMAEMFVDAGTVPPNMVFEKGFKQLVLNTNNKQPVAVYNIKDPNVPGDAVLVDRTTEFGNPFHIGEDGDRDEVIAKYRDMVMNNPQLKEKIISELKGKNLMCHCKPKACHADVLLEIANSENDKRK